MTQSRPVLNEEKRSLLKERFFDQMDKNNKNMAEECWVMGTLLGVSFGYGISTYLFLTGMSMNPMLMLLLPMGGYAGAQLGKKATPSFFKEKMDPSDVALVQFEKNDQYRAYAFR